MNNNSLSRRQWLQAVTAIGIAAAGSILFVSLATAGEEPAPSVIDVASRRELFVEDHLIEKISGEAALRLHHPTPREISMVFDAPWEGSASGYHTIFQDGDLYRMYYRGFHLEVSQGKLASNRHEPFYCYAESTDGVRWTRPELGIVEFDGSKKNNIILKGRGTHNFAPFKDTNPDCPPDARYKGLGGLKGEGGLFAFQSADGLHWSLITDKPVITNGAFDSQNLAFWDATLGGYRAYWRTFTKGVTSEKKWAPAGYRAIRTATSDDFLGWSGDADLTYVDSPDEHLYTNQINPYFRAPHILIGFPCRYVERGWSDSMRALPELKNRELRASSSERYGTALTEGVLMASRDGVRFKRWNEAFLRPGVQRPGTWQYGQQYIACHVVQTAPTLPGTPDELSLYATEGYWHNKGGILRRFTLRLDGFVSIRASMTGGELLSRPLTFTGSRLSFNFATSAAGSIRVEIQDPDGKPHPGFALDDCPALFGDTIERTVTWKNGPDVAPLAGKPVRLRVELKDADLYSFQFQAD
jgi:hypothetical protein